MAAFFIQRFDLRLLAYDPPLKFLVFVMQRLLCLDHLVDLIFSFLYLPLFLPELILLEGKSVESRLQFLSIQVQSLKWSQLFDDFQKHSFICQDPFIFELLRSNFIDLMS